MDKGKGGRKREQKQSLNRLENQERVVLYKLREEDSPDGGSC